jgi:ribonucleotide reductase alpha subunit
MEMGLEPYELCNLVETFPFKHESLSDYLRTVKFAFLYAKTVTLECTHMPKTNEVMMRNRRIGTSVTGVTQFIAKHGLDTFRKWLDTAYHHIQQYDKRLSEVFCVPQSVKTTTVKPSGTVSLLAGATAGMHFPIMQCYIRRITISNDSHLYEKLKNAGYDIEPRYICTDSETGEEVFDKDSSIVSCPVYLGDECTKTESNVTMWEQLALAAFLQRWWADNQVSCTVKFDPKTEGPHLVAALEHFQYHLKGISFLPKQCDQYRQAPYEAISYEKYLEMTAKLNPLDFGTSRVPDGNHGCSSSSVYPSEKKVDEEEEVSSDEDEDEDDAQDPMVQSLVDVLPDSLNFCDGDQCVISK